MKELQSRLVCHGCGATPPAHEPLPFRCPRAAEGDDTDHLLRRRLEARAPEPEFWQSIFLRPEPNPFIRYRRLLHSWRVATERSMSDADFVELVQSLDERIEAVDGRGFRETPFDTNEWLSERMGTPVLVKDETGNVSGSHKARHLMGILLWLEVARKTDLLRGEIPTLAIASCGNAALAAAVVARAAGLALEVFIPPDAHPAVVKRLEDLGAILTVCPREAGVSGDPCMHQFHQALQQGRLPFSVQGNENGLSIEGGWTLGWEIVSSLLRSGTTLDRIFIQVGGGALASSTMQAFEEAKLLGLIERVPMLHAVQTEGAWPLLRAWDRVIEVNGSEELRKVGTAGLIEYAATHRSEFMSPWEEMPHSIAPGILDDETYDWLEIVRGMLETEGSPIVVSEEDLQKANEIARTSTGIPVDPTGSAGLAGLLRMKREGAIAEGETVAVLFTGRER